MLNQQSFVLLLTPQRATGRILNYISSCLYFAEPPPSLPFLKNCGFNKSKKKKRKRKCLAKGTQLITVWQKKYQRKVKKQSSTNCATSLTFQASLVSRMYYMNIYVNTCE